LLITKIRSSRFSVKMKMNQQYREASRAKHRGEFEKARRGFLEVLYVMLGLVLRGFMRNHWIFRILFR